MKYRLTTQQQNIWNLIKTYNPCIANISGYITFNAILDTNLLTEAINKFVEMQAGTRLQIELQGKDLLQFLSDYKYFNVPIKQFDDIISAKQFFTEEGNRPFLVGDKLYRFCIFKVEKVTGIFLCFSHLVADAWSLSLFCDCIIDCYNQLSVNADMNLQCFSYIDYIEKESAYFLSEKYKSDRTFWENHFSEKPELSFIVPQRVNSIDGKTKRFTSTLNKSFSGQICDCCKDHNLSPSILFEAAVFIYIHNLNPLLKENIIGIPVLNRTTRSEKKTVGMFISTVPLGIKIDERETVENLFADISSAHSAVFRHQQYPYSDILRYLREQYSYSGNLFDVIVSYQNAKINAACNCEYHTEWLNNGYGETPFAIHIDDRDSNGRFTVNLDYQTALFSEDHTKLIFERIMYILKQLISNCSTKISDIRVMPDSEYNKVIYTFNETYSEYPREKCVHEMFSQQAERTPEKTALIFEDKEFTYRQLDEMSNSLAHYLREKAGVKPNDIVPIISKRSWHVVVAMLGILKAGGAYMPVDPSYPKDRIEYMLSDAQSSIALTYGYDKNLQISSVDLDTFDFSSSASQIENVSSPDDTCYVIFTSGSTGKPKGALLSHKNTLNYLCSTDVFHTAIVQKSKRVLAIGSFSFDISICETLQLLLFGIVIVLANDNEINNIDEIAKIICYRKIDTMQLTPTKLESYMINRQFSTSLFKIKIILLAGETLSNETLKKARKLTCAEIYNGYGPTETTVGCSFTKVNNNNEVTIGRPISNTQIYILDERGKPCPIGVPGELCISGDGVGKGYLNRPELTAEKFVSDPFAAGKTMYRSGDLARWRPDGELEYLGRIDTQVKIRGLRIELGEIESVMNSYEGIHMTAVADKKDESGRQYLVGYYTSDKAIDEKRLREYLSTKLPRYMVPNYFMQLSEMPMTTSGKTDRKNLPQPEVSDLTNKFVEPTTITEKILCDTASNLFGNKKIGTNDNFFELGGDSLTAMQFVAVLYEKGITISMQDVYEFPTLTELGTFIDDRCEIHNEYRAEDFKDYESILINNSSDKQYNFKYKPLGNIFITGVTGFLGAHLLNEVFDNGCEKIYCLVRSREKLQNVLHYYFRQKYDFEIGKRIVPIIGDITKKECISDFPSDVNTVIHSAANVKHYGNYFDFEEINVIGTANMLEYANSISASFAYISTTSVSGMALNNSETETKIFKESDIYIGQILDNVYIRSKFEAERLVLDKIITGMKCRIFRIGNLTNRYSDALFQPNYQENAFLKRIKVFANMQMIPDNLLNIPIEMTPVDMAARAIILLMRYADDQQTVFHISNSNNKTTYKKFVEIFGDMGIKLSISSAENFMEKIESVKTAENSFIINDINEVKRTNMMAKVIVDNSYTAGILSKVGFEWVDLSRDYLKRYINYFKCLNYFECKGDEI